MSWYTKIPTERITWRLVSFLIVGGSAAAAYALICTLLLYFFPSAKIAVSIGVHVFMIPIAFFGQRHVTFRSSNPLSGEFARYASLQLVSISASSLVLTRLLTNDSFLNIIVFLAIAGLAAIISFVICNGWVFRGSERVVPRK